MQTACYTWRSQTAQSLDPALIRAAVEHWRQTVSIATCHNYRNQLYAFLTYADDIERTHLRDCLPHVTAPSPRTTTWQEEEFAKLYAIAPLWMRTFLTLCHSVGLRNSEARLLTPQVWDREKNTIKIHRKKSDAISELPLPDALKTAFTLCAEQAPEKPVVETLGLDTNNINAINRLFNDAKKKAGISRQLHIHDLRRTIATRVYQKTKDLRIVQELLGHKNTSTTFHYIAPRNPEEIRAALREAMNEQTQPADPMAQIPLASQRPQ